jgi:hypothetical protein
MTDDASPRAPRRMTMALYLNRLSESFGFDDGR